MATISRISFCKTDIDSSFTLPDSIKISIQNNVSSASSYTIPSLLIKSARERARQAERKFATTDVIDRITCFPIISEAIHLGNDSTKCITSTASIFVLFLNSSESKFC